MRTSVRSNAALPRRAFRPAGVAAALALAALLGMAGPARAQRLSPVTGEALMKLCTSKTPVGCDAYVSGVSDEAELLGRSNAEPTDRDAMQFCIPADVKGSALRQTVVAWAQAHGEDSKLPAAMLVVHAFRASFPCKGGTPAGSPAVR